MTTIRDGPGEERRAPSEARGRGNGFVARRNYDLLRKWMSWQGGREAHRGRGWPGPGVVASCKVPTDLAIRWSESPARTVGGAGRGQRHRWMVGEEMTE